MKTIFILLLFISSSLRAQDPFGREFKETPKSDDVAFVFLNDTDGKFVEGFSVFALNNILGTHYKRENIIMLNTEEVKNCTEALEKPNKFLCKLISSNPEECDENNKSLDKLKDTIDTHLQKYKCPRLKEIQEALERGKNIDAYAATHGGGNRVIDMAKMLGMNGMRPDIQNKLRLFYSMGCQDAKVNYDIKGRKLESSPAYAAIGNGFSTFLGHQGTSLSPLIYTHIMTMLKMGSTVEEIEKKLNVNIENTILGKGTKLHLVGDPNTSIQYRANINKNRVKKCNSLIGKSSLSKMLEADCLNSYIITQYLNKFPELIDEQFCKSSNDQISLYTEPVLALSIAACSSQGYKMKSSGIANIVAKDSLKNINNLNRYSTCMSEDMIAKLMYCTHKDLGSSEFIYSVVLGETLVENFDNKMPDSKRVKILNEFKKLKPSDCSR